LRYVKGYIGSLVRFGIHTADLKCILGNGQVGRIEFVLSKGIRNQSEILIQNKLLTMRRKRMTDFLFNRLTVNQNIVFLGVHVIETNTVFVVVQISILRLATKRKQQLCCHRHIRRIVERILGGHLTGVCEEIFDIRIIVLRELLQIKGQKLLFNNDWAVTVYNDCTRLINARPIGLCRVCKDRHSTNADQKQYAKHNCRNF